MVVPAGQDGDPQRAAAAPGNRLDVGAANPPARDQQAHAAERVRVARGDVERVLRVEGDPQDRTRFGAPGGSVSRPELRQERPADELRQRGARTSLVAERLRPDEGRDDGRDVTARNQVVEHPRRRARPQVEDDRRRVGARPGVARRRIDQDLARAVDGRLAHRPRRRWRRTLEFLRRLVAGRHELGRRRPAELGTCAAALVVRVQAVVGLAVGDLVLDAGAGHHLGPEEVPLRLPHPRHRPGGEIERAVDVLAPAGDVGNDPGRQPARPPGEERHRDVASGGRRADERRRPAARFDLGDGCVQGAKACAWFIAAALDQRVGSPGARRERGAGGDENDEACAAHQATTETAGIPPARHRTARTRPSRREKGCWGG